MAKMLSRSSRCSHCGQTLPEENSLFGQSKKPEDWLPVREWIAFMEMRKKIGKPLTDFAKVLAIAKLEELKNSGENPQLVLQQSILNDYQGLFPVKKEEIKNGNHVNQESMLEVEARREREYREKVNGDQR